MGIKLKVMVNMHNNEIRKLKDEFTALREKNGQSITSLEAIYNDQLVLKHTQYRDLENKSIANAIELKK